MAEEKFDPTKIEKEKAISMLKNIEKTLYKEEWQIELQEILDKYKSELGVSFRIRTKKQNGGNKSGSI